MRELTIDSFAGGGGASTGIELATGRSVDVAINHDEVAIKMHKTNHPTTRHYIEDVWEVDPLEATQGQPVGLMWLSPDCKHFSKAKGGKPVDKNIRGLAWVAVKWAKAVKPRVIMLENVEEFKTWGPLKNGYPDPSKKGQTFHLFTKALEKQGYKVEFRELKACDYGAPTTRKRFFMIARCDGRKIEWPEPTHGDPEQLEARMGLLKSWRTAAEIINWELPCPSIFDTAEEIKEKHDVSAKRPLADNTMKRIAKGTQKFVIDNPQPFIIRVNHSGSNHHYCNSIDDPLSTITSKNGWGVVTPFLTQYHSYKTDEARGQTIDRSLMTIDTNPRYALTSMFFSKYYGAGVGSKINGPLHTITSKDRVALIETHLCVLRNNMDCKSLQEPLPTITTSPGHFAKINTVLTKISTTKDLGHWPRVREMLNKYCGYSIADDEIMLFEIEGEFYFISDIGMRMLEPRELFNANGFPSDYIIDHDDNGNSYSKAAQVARVGNSVPPPFAKVLVEANLPELCKVTESLENIG